MNITSDLMEHWHYLEGAYKDRLNSSLDFERNTNKRPVVPRDNKKAVDLHEYCGSVFRGEKINGVTLKPKDIEIILWTTYRLVGGDIFNGQEYYYEVLDPTIAEYVMNNPYMVKALEMEDDELLSYAKYQDEIQVGNYGIAYSVMFTDFDFEDYHFVRLTAKMLNSYHLYAQEMAGQGNLFGFSSKPEPKVVKRAKKVKPTFKITRETERLWREPLSSIAKTEVRKLLGVGLNYADEFEELTDMGLKPLNKLDREDFGEAMLNALHPDTGKFWIKAIGRALTVNRNDNIADKLYFNGSGLNGNKHFNLADYDGNGNEDDLVRASFYDLYDALVKIYGK